MRATKKRKPAKAVRTKKKWVTLDEVAARAGLSRSTASLVLRQSDLISPETKARVRQAMRELGYVYNRSAANLRTQRTHILGMVIANVSNPFYGILASGIEQACNREDYLTIYADSGEDSARQDLIISRLIEQGVAGIFLCPAEGSTPDVVLADRMPGTPVVQIMRHLDGNEGSYVGPDNVQGAAEAVEHLIGLGHKRIAMLSGPESWSSGRERKLGYLNALKDNGIQIHEELIIPVPIDRKASMQATLALLDRSQPPTAIFCFNDTMAFGAMLGLMNKGRVPGRDIAVMGFDDIPEAALWTPSLSTVAIDATEIGRLAAELLLREVRGESHTPQRIIIKPRLIVRESSGRRLD